MLFRSKFLEAPLRTWGTTLEQGLNVGATKAEGGDVRAAANAMGANVSSTAVSSTLGMVDPTGMLSGAAGDAVKNAMNGKQSQPGR